MHLKELNSAELWFDPASSGSVGWPVCVLAVALIPVGVEVGLHKETGSVKYARCA